MQSHAAYVIPRQLWHGLKMRISTTITHKRKNPTSCANLLRDKLIKSRI